MLESIGHALRSNLYQVLSVVLLLATAMVVAQAPVAEQLDGGPDLPQTPAAADGAACDGRPRHGTVTVPVPFGGTTHRVGVYVPDGYDDTRPSPLVLNLHGSNSNGAAQLAISGMRRTADRHDFVVAVPEGGMSYPGSRTGRAWHIPGVPLFGGHAVPPRPRDDVAFVRTTLDVLTRTLCLDPRRVYVTGFSGGARMTSLLACHLADRIAAVAPVAGVRAGSPDTRAARGGPRPDCRPGRAVPVLAFHGRQDRANAFDGDSTRRWRYPVMRAMERWAHLDGCAEEPRRTRPAARVERLSWTGCDDDAEVTLYVSGDAGHTWPGSAGADTRANGRVDRGTAANELMWRFFERYRLPDR